MRDRMTINYVIKNLEEIFVLQGCCAALIGS